MYFFGSAANLAWHFSQQRPITFPSNCTVRSGLTASPLMGHLVLIHLAVA
jgi:hypothetical protein